MTQAAQLLRELSDIGVSVELGEGVIWLDPIAAVPTELRVRLAANKPELLAYLKAERRLHIGYVLNQLDNLQLYRDEDSLIARRSYVATQHQRDLISTYHAELMEALQPQSLSESELDNLALLAHDVGQDSRELYELAAQSPGDREHFRWVYEGRPEFSEEVTSE